MKAKYEKEVEKGRAVVDAERRRRRLLSRLSSLKLRVKQVEAEQKKLAAKEYKQEQQLRGEGDAAYKRQVMQADGALAQKLDAWIKVNERYATAMEKQKWVPEVMMGGNSSGATSAQEMINMMMIKTAKDLSLDMKVK